MLTIEERLRTLMAEGWNVVIECKSNQREFAMTYEAHGSNNSGNPFQLPIHAVADSLNRLLNKLEEQVMEWSVVE